MRVLLVQSEAGWDRRVRHGAGRRRERVVGPRRPRTGCTLRDQVDRGRALPTRSRIRHSSGFLRASREWVAARSFWRQAREVLEARQAREKVLVLQKRSAKDVVEMPRKPHVYSQVDLVLQEGSSSACSSWQGHAQVQLQVNLTLACLQIRRTRSRASKPASSRPQGLLVCHSWQGTQIAHLLTPHFSILHRRELHRPSLPHHPPRRAQGSVHPSCLQDKWVQGSHGTDATCSEQKRAREIEQ